MNLQRIFEVTRRERDGKHLYSITGMLSHQDMNSVTHYTDVIPKPGLGPWMVNQSLDAIRKELYGLLGDKTKINLELDIDWIDALLTRARLRPDQVKQDAADYGTITHAAIDEFIKTGKMPDYDPNIEPAIKGFLKWWGKGRNIVMGDTMVASMEMRYGGAFDAVELRDDGYWIHDWKTSNALRDSYPVQVGGGYAIAFEETFGVVPAGATIVRFGKNKPSFEARDVIDINRAKEAFIHCRGLKLCMAKSMYKPVEKKEK